MSDSVMQERAKALAIEIIKVANILRGERKEYSMSDQLLRCGTSIGANIYESKYAQSNADFISKMQIALKESNELEFWLDILISTGYITKEVGLKLTNDNGIIRRMLINSINTAKKREV